MRHISFDGPQEGFLWGAIEQLDFDRLLAFQKGNHQAMHPVDHAHTAPIHENRRKGNIKIG